MKRLSLSLLLLLVPILTKTNDSWVYLSNNVRKTFLELHRALPQHRWSPEFAALCKRIEEQTVATTLEEATKSIVECIDALQNNCCDNVSVHESSLVEYAEQLQNNKATLSFVDENGSITRACNSKCKFKKGRAYCSLLTKELTVCGNTTLNNLRVLGNLSVDGTITFNDTIIINGDQIINGNLAVSGNGAFGGDLAVAGDEAINGNLAVAGNAEITGDLTVDGTVTFANVVVDDLTVNGTFTTLGPVNMGTNASDDPINIGTNALLGRAITIGSDIGDSSVEIIGDTSRITLGFNPNEVTINTAATGSILIGTDAVAQTINIGNATGATAVAILSGTGDIILQSTDDIVVNSTDDTIVNATGDVTVDATSLVEINASAGPINIGNDPAAQPINIGIAGARTITLGNITGATAVTVNSGTGGVSVNSTGTGDITLTSSDVLTINSTGNMNIGVNTAVQNINIGTGAAEKDVIIGNTNTASSVTIRADDALANGITLEAGGFVLVETATITSGSGIDTVILNTRAGKVIFPGFTTAAGSEQEFTITDAVMDPDSAILVTAANRGVNDAQMTVQRVEPLAGSFIVTLQNNGTQALNGDIIITFWILQQ